MPDDNTEQGFLQAIEQTPGDTTTHLAYADWLEEQGRPHDAILQRIAAGVSEANYKLRRTSDGLYSEGNGRWTTGGKVWRRLEHLKSHLTGHKSGDKYFSTS